MNRELGWKLLDSYRRKNFLKYEIKNIFLKNFNNRGLSILEVYAIQMKLSKIKPIHSVARINHRCVISGRTHNVNSKFKMSRFFLRDSFKKNSLGLISKK